MGREMPRSAPSALNKMPKASVDHSSARPCKSCNTSLKMYTQHPKPTPKMRKKKQDGHSITQPGMFVLVAQGRKNIQSWNTLGEFSKLHSAWEFVGAGGAWSCEQNGNEWKSITPIESCCFWNPPALRFLMMVLSLSLSLCVSFGPLIGV